ncbi:hypothetical protein HDC90_002141 [Pedobacter sp. AK013]|uniref:hypothetical protein n=1 Tax=Pedobacter sp. AK013 TaxID=2723071 RepID=UPI00161E582F|nr:hypothetical protein [Pedobacter sp. AK013]MBB6237519.1 hypothetical protein [Pedobacter sp. AK013]
MKHLFFALICSVIGFSAVANGLTPKNTPFITKNIEVKTIVKEHKITLKIKGNKTEKASRFRRVRTDFYVDNCGQGWWITVTAPDGYSNYQMTQLGAAYVSSHMDSHGCL